MTHNVFGGTDLLTYQAYSGVDLAPLPNSTNIGLGGGKTRGNPAKISYQIPVDHVFVRTLLPVRVLSRFHPLEMPFSRSHL